MALDYSTFSGKELQTLLHKKKQEDTQLHNEQMAIKISRFHGA